MRLRPLVLLIALCGGCHRGQPIVGNWRATETVNGRPIPISIEFRPDGTMTSTTTVATKNTTVQNIYEGTWRLEGNLLTTHCDSLRFQIAGSEPALSRMRQVTEARRAEFLAESNKHPTDAITWHGNDEFRYTDSSGSVITWNRVK